MPTHTISQGWERGTDPLAGTFTASAPGELNFDAAVNSGGQATLPGALSYANVESLFIESTQDMTLRVNGVNEVQTLTPSGTISGGSFTITYSGQTTAAIAYNATAADVQAALIALSNIGDIDVSCTGGPINSAAVSITFRGALAATNVSQVTYTSSLTGGGSLSIATATGGVAASQTISLKANVPLVWIADAGYYANPLTANWTSLLVSNDSGAPGSFYARVLYN